MKITSKKRKKKRDKNVFFHISITELVPNGNIENLCGGVDKKSSAATHTQSSVATKGKWRR